MMKTLLYSGFLALFLSLSGVAAAQEDALSEIPTGGPAPAVAAQKPATRTFISGSMPINMRPGAYVAHNTDSTTEAGRKSYPEAAYQRPKPTSVQAYNQNRARARISQYQSSGSLIASPFPAGYGE